MSAIRLLSAAVLAAAAVPALAAPVIESPVRADAPAAAPTSPAPEAKPKAGLFGWTDAGWDSSFDAGLNGTSGNTDSVNVHLAFQTAHTGEKGADKYKLTYDLTKSDTGVTQDQFVAEGTRDFFFAKDSRWGAFVNLRYVHDNFAAWEHVASVFVGPSYRFLTGPEHTLTGRLGVGGSYRDNAQVPGAEDGTFTPEALLGLDYVWVIDERSKFEASTTVFPSLEDFLSEFRAIATCAYSLAIDANKALKMGAEYNYNSNVTDPVRKGDVKWFVALSMKL